MDVTERFRVHDSYNTWQVWEQMGLRIIQNLCTPNAYSIICRLSQLLDSEYIQ
jgi:hypothetical protein